MDNQQFTTGARNAGIQGNCIPVYDPNVAGQVFSLQQTFVNGTQYIAGRMDRMEMLMQNATRGKRKTKASQLIAVDSVGEIDLMEVFDDGSRQATKFIINISGEWRVYRLKFTKLEPQKAGFAVFFETNQFWIFGNLEHNTGKGLYECFIRAGICFNPSLTKSRIQDALFQAIGPQIENAEQEMRMPGLAGWHDGKFYFAEVCPPFLCNEFGRLPILDKKLANVKEEEENLCNYVSAVNCIADWRNRVIMLAYPLAGILASILSEENASIPIYLNFVILEEADYQLIPAFLQIYNRDELLPMHMGQTEKRLSEILQNVNDEVIIFEAFAGNGETAYQKKKMVRNCELVSGIVLGKHGLHREHWHAVNAALVIISDSMALNNAALNIFAEENFVTNLSICKQLLAGDVVADVFLRFINYAGNQMKNIREIIRKNRDCASLRYGFWAAMYEILVKFWNTLNIDIREAANLPYEMDMEELYKDNFERCEDLRETFIHLFRQEMRHFYVCAKNKAERIRSDCIYFSGDYLWMQPELLDRMLVKNHLLAQKNPILLELRDKGDLKTDSVGLKSRLQIGGKRIETFKFCRESFNILGGTEIIDLGREEGNDAD